METPGNGKPNLAVVGIAADAVNRAKVMQNELVLAKVAKNLPAGSLRAIRETCPPWNHIFGRGLHGKQETVKLIASHRHWNPNYPKEGPAMQSWTNLFRATATAKEETQEIHCPTTKYRLYGLYSAPVADVSDFFRVCGQGANIITHLDLEFVLHREREESSYAPVNMRQIRWIIFDQAPKLEELRLRIWSGSNSFSPNSTFRANSLARDLPNLRLLEFWSFHPDGVPEREPSASPPALFHPTAKDFLAELLRHATKLSCLSMSAPDDIIRNLFFLSSLRDYGQPSSLSKLTTFKIKILDMLDLEVLLELANRPANPLRLQVLDTSIFYIKDDNCKRLLKALHRFLVSQSKSLRDLRLEIFNDNYFDYAHSYQRYEVVEATATVKLPILPVVGSFSLKCYGLEPGGQLLGRPLGVIFPRLVLFDYTNLPIKEDGEYKDWKSDNMLGFCHAGVTDLRLHTNYMGNDGDVNSNVFLDTYGLQFQLQLLTRLHITIQGSRFVEIFPQLCNSMPALEVLQIECWVKDDWWRVELKLIDLDPLISGIPYTQFQDSVSMISPDDMKALNDSLTVAQFRSGLEQLTKKYKTKPAIQDLRCLKKIEFAFDMHRFRLTDNGGYFGLALASPTLQHIEITGTCYYSEHELGKRRRDLRGECNLISKDCEEYIQNCLGQAGVISW